jgi:excisionase family DNA binding protein
MGKLVNSKQLAAELGQSQRTIRSWIAARKIPFLKVGHRTMLFSPEKVLAALQKFKVKAATK